MRRRISCEDNACPLRRGMQELHIVLLFRLSPKWGMNRIVARRQFMNIDVVGFLAPRERRGRPSLVVQIALSQIECDNRRAVFDGRANKGVLVHLRDSRLKLHLHCNRHPIPFVTTDLPMDK